MVIYDLICPFQHEFEGWFKNADDYQVQRQQHLLTCPVCNSADISKKLAAPKLAKKSNTLPAETDKNLSGYQSLAASQSHETYQQVQSMLSKMHEYLESNFTDVGNRFAEQALAIHNGDKEADNIRGTATRDEIKELAKEGVQALPLPPKPVDKSRLN